MGKKAAGKQFSRSKRHPHEKDAAIRLEEAIMQLNTLRLKHERVIRPQPCAFAYDVDKGELEKIRMVDALWGCSFESAVGSLLAENPDLALMLRGAVSNTYRPDDAELFMVRQDLK